MSSEAKLGRASIYGYLAYFTLLFFSFLPYVATDLCYIDELTYLAEAKRTLLYGDHEHRDFFSFHGGLNFYVVALMWKLLGRVDHQSVKLLTFIAITAGCVLLTVIARRYTRRFWLSLLPASVYAYLGHTFPFANHHWFGSVSTVLFLYALSRYLETVRVRELFFCGVTAALSLLFIMHEGIVNAGTGALAALATIVLLNTGQSAVRVAGAYVGGFTAVMLPALTFYAAIGALGRYFYNTFVWPFTNYKQANNVNNRTWAVDINLWTVNDGGNLMAFLSYWSAMAMTVVPVVVLIAGLAALTAPNSFGYQRDRKDFLSITVWLASAFGIYLTAFSQPTFIKLLWGSVPLLILTVMAADWLCERLRDYSAARRALSAVMIFTLISIVAVPVYRSAKLVRGDESELAGATSAHIADHPLAELLNRECGPQDYLFGYKFASLYYYLVNARPATGYTLFVEDYLSRAQLDEIFADLERREPKFMIFSSDRDLLWLAEQNRRFPVFLNERYYLRGTVENWLVYQRKD